MIIDANLVTIFAVDKENSLAIFRKYKQFQHYYLLSDKLEIALTDFILRTKRNLINLIESRVLYFFYFTGIRGHQGYKNVSVPHSICFFYFTVS